MRKFQPPKFKLMTGFTAAMLTISMGLTSAAAFAETAEEKGLRLAQEADAYDIGWGDSSVEMEMILRNRQGQESKRQLRSRALEKLGDGDWSMTIFDEPKDVKGTALLTHSHKVEPDDQWLYLPALKRVKRIASNNKSGPFMGSEFAYEDLSSQEIEKYKNYKWIKEEPCGDGWTCNVGERVPVDPKSGYTKQVYWIDQAHHRLHKVDFYDRKGELLKTLTASGHAVYKEKHWRPAKLDMVNHQTGKSTTLNFSEYKFDNGYTDRDFDQNSLKSAR